MNIQTLEVAGFAPAIKGMRNPMNSWTKSNSGYNGHNKFILGENDLPLAQHLIQSGTEHCKFLRQIQVWADFNMPRYWWSEFDTYHYNTKNSCSTMHKLFNKQSEITLDMFEHEECDTGYLNYVIAVLNELRKEYFDAANSECQNKILKRAKTLLPEGYLQLRTVNTNYAELRNIYLQRQFHRLKEEWQDMFCTWVRSLPYAEQLIIISPCPM